MAGDETRINPCDAGSELFEMRRRLFLLGGAGLASALCGLSPNGEPHAVVDPSEDDSRPFGAIDNPASAIRPEATGGQWDLIGTLGFERMLESITLVPAAPAMAMGQDPKQFPKTLFPRLQQVSYEESDPELMNFLSHAFPHFPLRFVRASGSEGGWLGSGMRLSLLKMRTNVDTFWISITRVGFAIGSSGADFESVFYSATLTRALEIIYTKATGEQLPKLIAEALSGGRQIRVEKEQFERWKAKQR
jgi:hypothetical protein